MLVMHIFFAVVVVKAYGFGVLDQVGLGIDEINNCFVGGGLCYIFVSFVVGVAAGVDHP